MAGLVAKNRAQMTPRSILCVFSLGGVGGGGHNPKGLCPSRGGCGWHSQDLALSLLVPALDLFMPGAGTCPIAMDLSQALPSPRRKLSLPPTKAERYLPGSSLTCSPSPCTDRNCTIRFSVVHWLYKSPGHAGRWGLSVPLRLPASFLFMPIPFSSLYGGNMPSYSILANFTLLPQLIWSTFKESI